MQRVVALSVEQIVDISSQKLVIAIAELAIHFNFTNGMFLTFYLHRKNLGLVFHTKKI